MDQYIGEAKHNDVWNFQEVDNGHQIVPNQSEFGLICVCVCVWVIIVLFPNQTGIGLKNRMHFLGVTIPNQTGFGLEKDTEWNVATWPCHYCIWIPVKDAIKESEPKHHTNAIDMIMIG